MEGERLPQVTVELEGKKGRGRKKHEKKKVWSQAEELRGSWRAQMKRYIMNIGQKWIKFKRKRYGWIKMSCCTELVHSRKEEQ